MCKKCAMAKVLALIFNQTIYEKILMLTGTLRAFDFFENMLLHPKFTKMNFGAFDFLKTCYYILSSQICLIILNGPAPTLSPL